ncbi:helix-turn-helix domain-containing protein [Hymenobacter sp. H14-R3]|uniref:helix-turn-helix domain-containing protein n=1 Tax=Hymenobacter sp. H14-R3 TaxID=3046308 RepID=UPI0024BBB5E7|nr:helix-turn-helix domain-containing protein [Hymenobacter sp. H14-R3]MDJ0366556.1 helix-turn-helix domain-containing protein [Hymenobacter sp. H14-R3]
MSVRKAFLQLDYLIEPACGPEADLVDAYWQMANPGLTPQAFTVLTDGCCKLLLQRQPNQEPELILSGVWTHAFEIRLPAATTLLGVRFKLPAVEFLCPSQLPLNATRPLPLTEGLGPALLAAHDLADLARRVGDWAASRHPAPAPRALFAALYASHGTLPVSQLAAAAGWSARTVNRYFQRQFGLSLKTYADILRSYAATQQLRPGDLYAVGAYYDQSHGIRDVKKHTGATPRQLDQHRHDRFIQLSPPLPPEQ